MTFNFPDPLATTQFTASNGITYSWDAIDGKWQIKRYAADFDDRYVNEEGGDTMEGPLQITGPRVAGDDADNPDLVSSIQVLNVDNTQNSGLHLRHSGTTKLYVGASDLSVAADIKFNRGAGTVIKTNQQDIFNIGQNEVAYLGETIEDKDLVTKKYVDDADEELRQDIIELEEEIDAIAPASERGTWAYNPVGNVSLPGAYTMFTEFRDDGLGNVASIFAAVKNIALNERDLDNTVHNFGGTDEGDLLEIFEENDADYGLYSIVSIEKIDNPNPGGIGYSYISIDVNLERTGNGDSADSRARFKVFKAPSGGDANAFVRKAGDNMEGTLDMEGASGRNKILNLASPTSDYQAANKIYVDNRLEGVVGRYIVKDVSNNPVSTDGHMGLSTSFYLSINQFSFGAKDLDGGVTKQLTDGDIIETFDTGNNKTNRFKVTDASNAPSVVKVEFVSGTSGYALQDVYQVQIYPGSGGEYVLKAGDNMEGELSMQGQGGRNKIIDLATPTSDYHAANKTYVDDKIGELLAKIEELEMASGTTESYQFRMNNKTTGGSTEIGSQMFINEIMSCDNDGDEWNGQNTHLLSSEYRHIYVCFEDGYQLNSTGQMSVVRYSNSNQYDIRNSNVGTFNISAVEVCPPDKSSGKNIYRAVIQLDAYKPGTDAFYPSWGQGNVYVTFSDGSLTKTSA